MEEITMAVQTKMQQETRGGVEEANRDDMATKVASRSATTPVEDTNAGDKLLASLEKSAQTLRDTAESIENRGLKLFLKVVAQERVSMYNSLRQAMGRDMVNPLDPARKPLGRSLQEGLDEIETSMVVPRQGRENVALSHLLDEEDALVAAYSTFSTGNSGSPLGALLEAQRTQIAKFDARLKAVGDGVEPIVARVFNSRIEGDIAIQRLKEGGLAPSQIDAATISQVARPVIQSTVLPVGPKSTMAAGAFAGGVVGALVGAALALFVWFAPGLVGWITVGPWALLIGAIIIGAVFGTVFGFFIGQNEVEDDLMVTADGLEHGELLVAAYPREDQVAMVEEILQVYHARELNP
jgi:hypothetical protein